MKHVRPIPILTIAQHATIDSRTIKSTNNNGCWTYKGCKNGNYPAVYINGIIYRLSRIVMNAPIDKDVLHLCDNPNCINPSHLRLGTHKQNMQEMRERRYPPRCHRKRIKWIETIRSNVSH